VGLGGEEGAGGGGEEGQAPAEDDYGRAAVGEELVGYLVADSGCSTRYYRYFIIEAVRIERGW